MHPTPAVNLGSRNRPLVSVLVLQFCALKLIFKLIFGKKCIAECAPSFELVRHRKYSEWAIITATVAVKIARRLFLRQQSL